MFQEIERKRFLGKRKRDARAHVRIVRHFPRRKAHWSLVLDFIGSSTLVLMVLPLWISALVSGLPFAFKAVNNERLVVGLSLNNGGKRKYCSRLQPS
jgi:hypothetical protein